GDTERKELVKRLNNRFTSVTELKPNEIFFHNAQTMQRIQGVGQEMKEKRIADNRAAEGKTIPPRITGESLKG
ncbi:MAG: hypothetical protein AAF492_04690, partial [Verrucomicrobiota bacterium]